MIGWIVGGTVHKKTSVGMVTCLTIIPALGILTSKFQLPMAPRLKPWVLTL